MEAKTVNAETKIFCAFLNWQGVVHDLLKKYQKPRAFGEWFFNHLVNEREKARKKNFHNRLRLGSRNDQGREYLFFLQCVHALQVPIFLLSANANKMRVTQAKEENEKKPNANLHMFQSKIKYEKQGNVLSSDKKCM